MKRIISLLLCLILSFSITGCGKEEYKPNLAEFGEVNADTSYTNQYGVRDSLNVKGVHKEDNSIVVETESPTENVTYANKNHIAVSTVDTEGKEYTNLTIAVEDQESNAKIIIKGQDVDKGKYLKIMPYKNQDGKIAEYEIN